MAGNGRSVAVDLGKLVCGAAVNKLLIVRLPKAKKSAPIDDTNSFICDAAEFCTGNFFLAYLPVYAKGHTHLDAHWLKPKIELPFVLYARTCVNDKWEMALIADTRPHDAVTLIGEWSANCRTPVLHWS